MSPTKLNKLTSVPGKKKKDQKAENTKNASAPENKKSIIVPERMDRIPPKLNEIELAHKKIIAEENLDEKALSPKIKHQMRSFNMLSARYEKQPSFASALALKKLSVTIADNIQTFIENANGATNNDSQSAQRNPKPIPASTAGSAETVKKDGDKIIAGTWDPKALADLKKDGRIYHEQLKKMLKVKSLPDVFVFDGVKLDRTLAYYYPLTSIK